MMIAISLALLLNTACLPSVEASADSCQISGKFQKIVFKFLGRELALTQSSFGLSIFDKRTGDLVCEDYVEPEQNTYPASSIKTLIAIAVLRLVDQGQIGLHSQIEIRQPNAAAECIDWDCHVYGPGHFVTVRQMLTDMLTVSNNLAANQLMDLATRPFINDTAVALQANTLRIYHKVYNIQDPEPDNPLRNYATAAGMVQMYREIATGRLRLLSASSMGILIDDLAHEHYHDSLNADFPANVVFYHKPGETSSSTSDGGYLDIGNNRVAVIVGLQNFHDYNYCSSSCGEKTGLFSLKMIGRATLDLIRSIH